MNIEQEIYLKILKKIENIVDIAKQKKIKIGFAESCTGGLLSGLFTDVSGVSEVFESSIISYSNQSKIDYLGVKKITLKKFGAVSHEVAEEMSDGLLKNSNIDLALSITGIAGPGGFTSTKPIGLVFISLTSFEKKIVKKFNFSGDRNQVRLNAVIEALNLLEQSI